MNEDSHEGDTIIIWKTPFSLMLVIFIVTPALVALSLALTAYNLVLMRLPGHHHTIPRGRSTIQA